VLYSAYITGCGVCMSLLHSQTFRRLSVEGRPVIRGWTWDSRGGSTLIKRPAFSHV
jgi:hypothetical protein